MEKIMLDVTDVCSLLLISKSQAYKVIRDLNSELEKLGKITVRGRVSKNYLISRLEIGGQ